MQYSVSAARYNLELMSKISATEAPSAPAFKPVLSRASLAVLVALLLLETTINFIDRQVLSVLAPTIRDQFQLTNAHGQKPGPTPW